MDLVSLVQAIVGGILVGILLSRIGMFLLFAHVFRIGTRGATPKNRTVPVRAHALVCLYRNRTSCALYVASLYGFIDKNKVR